jgi:hypothetical protein
VHDEPVRVARDYRGGVVLGGVVGVLSLLVTVYCVLDLATTRSQDVRGLPKPLWFPVLLLPVIGPVLYLVLGRSRPGSQRTLPKVLPEAGWSGGAPDDDEAFLRELRRRAEEQRRRAEEQRRRAEEQRRAAERDDGDRPD